MLFVVFCCFNVGVKEKHKEPGDVEQKDNEEKKLQCAEKDANVREVEKYCGTSYCLVRIHITKIKAGYEVHIKMLENTAVQSYFLHVTKLHKTPFALRFFELNCQMST